MSIYMYVSIYIYTYILYLYIHKILPPYTKHPLGKHGLVRNFHKVGTIDGVFRVMGFYRFAWLGFADAVESSNPTPAFRPAHLGHRGLAKASWKAYSTLTR